MFAPNEKELFPYLSTVKPIEPPMNVSVFSRKGP
jgi:hypothetical protein